MAENNIPSPANLPEGLRRQFAQVKRRWWQVDTAAAVGALVFGLLVSFLAVFISDRFWDTSHFWRVVFFVIGFSFAAAAVCWWLRRWVWQRREWHELARLVQKRYRRLGDRLLGIVELALEKNHSVNFSPALYQAAIVQVAAEAAQYDFRQSVNSDRARKCLMAASLALAAVAAAAITIFPAWWNSCRRWISPMADIPRFTLVRLTGLPTELIVPHGEPFTVTASVQYASFWKPRHATAWEKNSTVASGEVRSQRIQLQIPGQTENGVLTIRVGDASLAVKMNTVFRPGLRALQAGIHLPAYLQYPDQTEALQNGVLSVLTGSEISFSGVATRQLNMATITSDLGNPVSLQVDGEKFKSAAPLVPGAEYSFNWRDVLGLTNALPLRLAVNTILDTPPQADLPGFPSESAMLATDVLHIRTAASDDFGVRDLGLTWNVAAEKSISNDMPGEVKIMASSPRVKKMEKVFLWSPGTFHIPADATVDLQGFARDYFPGRQRIRTAIHRLHILTLQEHAEMVRRQLEDAMSHLEEVTRTQEKIAVDLAQARDDHKLAEAQKNARLSENSDEQKQNATRLENLSQKAAEAVQQAIKNPLFPPDTLKQWNQSAQQWHQLAQDKMSAAAAAMQNAQQPSRDQPQQMASAAEKANDVLKALQKMQEKAAQHLDDLQALTLAQRLDQISSQEKTMSGQLLKNVPEIIGLPPDELPEKFRLQENSLTNNQVQAEKDSDLLQNEISRFAERTQKTNYAAVSQDMKTARTTDELERLAELIGDNIAVQASGDLQHWSAQFKKWSDVLQPKSDSSGGSGEGSSSKSKRKDVTEQLIDLLRLRGRELTLAEQTTLLDQQKNTPAELAQQAGALAQTQEGMAGTLEEIQKKVDEPSVDNIFHQTGDSMTDVATLLHKPQTGPPTAVAEQRTADFLSDLVNLINEQAQRPQPQSSSSSSSSSSTSAQEMAFLMSTMKKNQDANGSALQPSSGQNHAGGGTGSGAQSSIGDASGKNGPGRNTEKASGVMQNAPAEFREALDNYFHGIESKN